MTTALVDSKLFDRPQPHSLAAEMALLGCLILAPTNIPDIRDRVGPADFYSAPHATIYTALLDAYDGTGGVDMDLVILRDRLERDQTFDAIGGAEYLCRLAEEVPSGVNWPHYANIIREHAASRRLIEATGEAMHRSMHDADPAEVAAWMETKLQSVRAGRDEPDEFTAEQAFDQGLTELVTGASGFYTTGLTGLDNQCGGVPMAAVTTVLGSSGSGKSSFVAALLKHFIFELRLGVGVFSNEVGATQYLMHIIQQASGIPINRLKRKGKPIDKPTELDICGWYDKMHGVPIRFCQGSLGPAGIFARAGAWKRQGIQVVVIDYIQNLARNGLEEYELVNEAMNTCRRMVNERGLTVIAVSQPIVSASRTAEPLRMSDCRGSSAIEEVTDMGFSIWRGCTGRTQRREESDEQWEQAKRHMEIHIVKNKRLGMVGMVPAEFDPPTTRIVA